MHIERQHTPFHRTNPFELGLGAEQQKNWLVDTPQELHTLEDNPIIEYRKARLS